MQTAISEPIFKMPGHLVTVVVAASAAYTRQVTVDAINVIINNNKW